MVDISVKSWLCQTEGHNLTDILLPVYISDGDGCGEDLSQLEAVETNRCGLVQLQQPEDGSPCVLTLSCSSSPLTAISRLLVVSEARTMEVYSQEGDYCGTARGERDDSVLTDSPDRAVLYKKQLTLKHPSSACEVKLLSLAGRHSVLVSRIVTGLWQMPSSRAHNPAIDMQQVQSLVDEMGTSLSPGAQNLMDMVRVQQLNQSSSVGGFLPLLMGGGLFSPRMPPATTRAPSQRADLAAPLLSPRSDYVPHGQEAPTTQNGAVSDGSSSPEPTPPLHDNDKGNEMRSVCGESRGPLSHAQLADMMSHFLKGQGCDLLPMLQGICGQVTKLRLDGVVEEKMRNGSCELDGVMERHLEEMEKRLKEHIDRRLDALEQKIETLLMNVLPQVTTKSSTVEGPASCRPPETTATASH